MSHYTTKTYSTLLPWAIVLFALLWILGEMYFCTAIGLVFSIYSVYKVIVSMGEKIPIMELMVSLAALQWIIGPFIEYANNFHHYRYHMYVDEITYMSYIVPAVLAFWCGTLIFKKTHSLNQIGEKVNQLLLTFPQLPYLLIIAGFVIPYFSYLFPAALAFVFFLLSNIKYIGVIYLLFSRKKKRWLIFAVTMLFTVTASIATGMFHDLLLWAMLTFTFVAHELRLSSWSKIVFALLGTLFAITIQSVKTEYRSMVWEGKYSGNKTALFVELAVKQWKTGQIVSPSSDGEINVRLNQGWIISAIMQHVPQYEPYAKGNTIYEGIFASLVPRALNPTKKQAGGQENFRKYTGLYISDGTSMGISLAGEGYANFGRTGGILFMFCWGLFISWIWKKLQDWSFYYPTLLIWSPIIFLQVVKAETEFVVVLNHLIKASFLVMGLLWLIKKTWGIRI